MGSKDGSREFFRSEEIINYRKKNRLSQEKLGALLKKPVSKMTISGWETGKFSPEGINLVNLCELMGVSVDFMLGLTEEKVQENNPIGDKLIIDSSVRESTELNDTTEHIIDQGVSIKNIIPPDNLVWIPVISPEVRPSAGLGNCYADSDLEWDVIEKVPLFDGELAALYSADSLLSMYVDGDSMEPQIHHGDLVVFNHCPNWVSGNIMVVCLDGRLMVKGVISKGDDKLPILRSTNKEYDDIHVSEDSFFVVYGRVLRIIRVSKPKPVI